MSKELIAKSLLYAGISFFPSVALAQADTLPSDNATEQQFSQDFIDANDQVRGIQPIVVTAQKREENLQDVPISVSALSAEDLEQQGVSSLNDILDAPPPGVTLQPFAGSETLLIIDLRGVTNADPGQGTTELGTAVYIDDVYLGRGQGLGLELADPERIEVLRGPQGTLFGRNAEGGAIRIVTRKPTGELGIRAKASIGNYDTQRYEAHIDLPEIAGFAVKLDYLNSSRDGYTKNGPTLDRLDSQKDFGALDAEGWRASVRWQPLDNLTVDYAYDNSKIKDVRDYYVLVAPPGGPGFATFGKGRPLNTSIYDRPNNTWMPLYSDDFVTKVSGHTLNIEYDLSDDITLRSISAYRKTQENGAGNLGGAFVFAPVPGLSPSAFFPASYAGTGNVGIPSNVTNIYGISGFNAYNDLDQDQFSQEFQFVGSTSTLEYVFGLYYFEEDVSDLRQGSFTIIYTDPGLTDAVSVNPFLVGNPNSQLTTQSAKSRSYAAFAQATWSPDFANNRLHITAGIRYTDDKKTFERTVPVNVIGAPFKEKRFDPAFTIAYDISPDVNVYARYAQAYRAGGVSVRSPSFTPFGAEINKAYEIGLKSEWLNNSLRFNLALFQNNIYNRQITAQLDPAGDPSITDTLNAQGNTRIRGGEMELVMVPTEGLQFSANYTYLQGKRPDSYRTIDPNAELRIQSLPKHAITVAVDYFGPEWDVGQIAAHFDYSTASSTPGTSRVTFNSFAYDIERDVANARIALRNIPAGSVDLTIAAYAKNIFDTAYPVFTAPGANAIQSAPARYGLELGFEF
ncbi:MAG: TonB-dependent receptor [Sphingomonadaceae bacterium]